eukprot:GHVP01015389.1.p1 GENE.GHVP01015389.1~~GHVP01015389.1.p1  ORF type:complete len:356 (+),score=83.83 GHVP01015389.1:39-1070(+)
MRLVSLLFWFLVKGQDSGMFSLPDEKPFDYGMTLEQLQGRLAEWFRRVDTDDNGKLNREEAENWLSSSMVHVYAMQSKEFFEELDLDKNGKLSRDEFTHLDESEKIDSPFTREEWLEALGTKFDLADQNHDLFLNHTEFACLTNPSLIPELLDFEIQLLFRGQDKDKDGKISLAEYLEQVDQVKAELEGSMEMNDISQETLEDFKNQMQEHFHEIDTDDTGFLEVEDLRMYFSDSSNNNETLAEIFTTDDMEISMSTIIEDPDTYLDILINLDILKYPSQYFFDPPFEFEDIGEVPHSEENFGDQIDSLFQGLSKTDLPDANDAVKSEDGDVPAEKSGEWDEL